VRRDEAYATARAVKRRADVAVLLVTTFDFPGPGRSSKEGARRDNGQHRARAVVEAAALRRALSEYASEAVRHTQAEGEDGLVAGRLRAPRVVSGRIPFVDAAHPDPLEVPMKRLVAIVLSLALLPTSLFAIDGGYKLPPPEIVKMLDAPATPSVQISPDAQWMLLVERPAMPSIADVARPWIGLAGVRVDPKSYQPQRNLYVTGVVLRDLAGKSERRIELPKDARVAEVGWSHTSRRFALVAASDTGLQLWVADVESAKPALVADRLNGVFNSAFDWMPDGDSVIVQRIPAGAKPPEHSDVPLGPSMQETSGSKTALRTYTDLLSTPESEAQFEHYATVQLERIDLAHGSSTKLGAPCMVSGVTASPDGKHLIVERVHRPFSYVLPYSLFPETDEVWDLAGKREVLVAEVPMGENIPTEGVRTEPRMIQWQASAPSTLVWAEAQDGGDPKRTAEIRDRWMALDAPFTAEPRELLKLAQRARGLQWMQAPNLVIASQYDRDKRWQKSGLYDLGTPGGEPRLLDDRSVNDRYGDPGTPSTRVLPNGARVVRQDGEWIYRSSQGASAEGTLPFLDRFSLSQWKSERLWRCEKGAYETPVAIVASSASAKPSVVTSYESPTEPPNYRLRDLEQGSTRALTSFPDPTPELRGIKQELVKYKRADGVDLSATLYLPKDYQPGTRLPLFVWAYPLEYNDASTAGQVSGSPWRFVRIRGASHLFLLTQNYAVLDNATMPVVGDPETMNDTFLEQIVASAQAAIDFAVERGVADRERVGVGGHSYGAFMTANLLAHCDLFRAGIARSGAYNRTLTPFGFQSERRTIWEAPAAYLELSPFLSAQKINEPLLLIHGEKDDNMGTFPIQSERMYQAIKGNGGTARFVELPGEAHGYQARESVLHTLAEMCEWLDKYVKNAPRKEGGGANEAASAHGEK
jgi:dipeptidyl aminopeptidase/acylaminoacyl peptidase